MAFTTDIDTPALLEDLEFLAQHGVGLTEAATRSHGISSRRHLDKWLRRQGQLDLLHQLTDNEPRLNRSRKAS